MDNNRKKISIDNMEFDADTGDLISSQKDMLNCSPAFSGILDGKVYVNNKLTAIDVNKFKALPKSTRERILQYPESDYTRDVLSQPQGSVTVDTFPNFKGISYTPEGEAIIMNDENGNPTRANLFM